MLTTEQKLKYAKTTAVDNLDLAQVLIKQLIPMLNDLGVVVTIDLRSKSPPAMGNYEYAVDLRPSRKMYAEIMALEAQLAAEREATIAKLDNPHFGAADANFGSGC